MHRKCWRRNSTQRGCKTRGIYMRILLKTWLLSFRVVAAGALFAAAGRSLSDSTLPPAPVSWTAAQDHQNMMEQLGIKALRPGPNGNEKAPNHANYDESKANPFPDLPD